MSMAPKTSQRPKPRPSNLAPKKSQRPKARDDAKGQMMLDSAARSADGYKAGGAVKCRGMGAAKKGGSYKG